MAIKLDILNDKLQMLNWKLHALKTKYIFNDFSLIRALIPIKTYLENFLETFLTDRKETTLYIFAELYF